VPSSSGVAVVQRIILSGKIYSAVEMHRLGLVDVLVPAGQGENAIYEFIHGNNRRKNGIRALYECRRHMDPVSYDELMKITEVWVDAALRLEDRDLKMMGRLVRSQQRQLTIRKEGLPIDPALDFVE
jgi:DSF synthase